MLTQRRLLFKPYRRSHSIGGFGQVGRAQVGFTQVTKSDIDR